MEKIDIKYKDYKKKSDIHGTILYPAVMIAPMQKEILKDTMREMKINSIFDPFHGSGTALYECAELSNEINLYGCDINPLANLITKVKFQGTDDANIDNDIEQLISKIKQNEYDKTFYFNNIDKWFREDIKEDLKKIRSSIISIQNTKNRLYFWYMLCDLIRKYSNTRSSTYKLHIKKQTAIMKMRNNLINDFIKAIKENKNKFKKRDNRLVLFKTDILKKIVEFDKNTFDIAITSPPYGDNVTTVPYGQFSMLSLYWIDSKDLELEGWELENYSKIDGESLGGIANKIEIAENDRKYIQQYINRIDNKKIKKVERFFSDYFKFLKEITRITRNRIIMTLGNRTVDGININLTDITIRYLEEHNFKNNIVMEREIPVKRLPRKTSKVNNQSVNSMNYEYVIIHDKI